MKAILSVSGASPPKGGNRLLVVRFERPATVLSSAALGGGLRKAAWIASFSVAKDWAPADPRADIRRRMTDAGLVPRDGVGLVTAVDVASYHVADALEQGWRVRVVATVGVGNAVAAGRSPAVALAAVGTINLIVLVAGRLTPAALVGAVQTATEAKTAALQAADIRTREGWPASGTSTDTVTVACLESSPLSHYAGPVMPVGAAISHAVRQSILTALTVAEHHD